MNDNRQDELELLKAQMQVLTSKLQKSEIISEEMIRVSASAHGKSLLGNKRWAYFHFFLSGILLPGMFLYQYFVLGQFSLMILILSLIFFYFNVYRSWKALKRSSMKDTFQHGSLTEIAAATAQWKKEISREKWMTFTIAGIWLAGLFYEISDELIGNLGETVFVFLIVAFPLLGVYHYFRQVSKATDSILKQIKALKED